MRKVEAAAAIEGAVMALGQAKQAAANQAPVGTQRDLARGAPLEHQAKRSGEPSTPPADVPASPPEGQRIRLGRPPQRPPTPIGPGTLVPKSQRPPRDRSLVDDLKLRSVDTLRDGSPNPAFDPFTPSFIAGHFKSEQRRTGSDDPRTWRNPKGYAAQHPNGRPYARYGEPQGTRLTWGTVEDNRDLQKPREFGQTPHLPDNPKPLPE